MTRLIFIALIVLVLIYYIVAILQYFGAIKFTKKKITFIRTLIPFYYLIF